MFDLVWILFIVLFSSGLINWNANVAGQYAQSPQPTAVQPPPNTPNPTNTTPQPTSIYSPTPAPPGSSPTPDPNMTPLRTTLSGSKLGPYIIGNTDGVKQILRGGPKVIKVVDPHLISDIRQSAVNYKTMYPNGKVMIRVFVDHNEGNYNLSDDPTEKARDFWNSYLKPAVDALYNQDPASFTAFDYISGPNENDNFEFVAFQDQNSVSWMNDFFLELTNLISSEGRGLKPALGDIPVQNLDPNNVSLLEPALTSIKNAGGVWTYHSFTLDYTKDINTEQATSLRYRQFYDNLPAGLKDIPMILNEGGVDERAYNPNAGWQKENGSAQDIANYQDWLTWYDTQIRQDSYIIGVNLFQSGSSDPTWASWDHEPVSEWLRDYIAGEN